MKILVPIMVLVLAGCAPKAAAPSTPRVSTPALVGNMVEDVGRAQVKLNKAVPLIKDAEPLTLIRGAQADLVEAVADGGAAVKQSEADLKAKAAADARIAALEANDPQRKRLEWTSYILYLLVAVCGVAAYFLPLLRGRFLMGAIIFTGMGALFSGLAYWGKPIAMWLLIAVGVAAVAFFANLMLHNWNVKASLEHIR